MQESEKYLERSRELRSNQAPAENLIWNRLKNRHLGGNKFRRQFVIEPYIVDFICFDSNLIIELDGGQHMDAIDYDRKRDAFLRSKNYTIVRYWNNEVFDNIEGVLENILNNLK